MLTDYRKGNIIVIILFIGEGKYTEIPFDIEFIADSFNLDGRYVGYNVKNDGHINSTYVISFEDGEGCSKKYTLQKINTYVFKDADKLM